MIITLSTEEIATRYDTHPTRVLNLLSNHLKDMNPGDKNAEAMANKLSEVAEHIHAIEKAKTDLQEEIEKAEAKDLASDTELEFNLFENLVEKVNVYGRTLKEAVNDELSKHQLVLHQ